LKNNASAHAFDERGINWAARISFPCAPASARWGALFFAQLSLKGRIPSTSSVWQSERWAGRSRRSLLWAGPLAPPHGRRRRRRRRASPLCVGASHGLRLCGSSGSLRGQQGIYSTQQSIASSAWAAGPSSRLQWLEPALRAFAKMSRPVQSCPRDGVPKSRFPRRNRIKRFVQACCRSKVRPCFRG